MFWNKQITPLGIELQTNLVGIDQALYKREYLAIIEI